VLPVLGPGEHGQAGVDGAALGDVVGDRVPELGVPVVRVQARPGGPLALAGPRVGIQGPAHEQAAGGDGLDAEQVPRALGVQADTREALLAYGSLSFNAIGPRNRHLEAALKRAEGVLEWIAESCRREALRPGSIGRAIYEAADTAGMPEETAASLVRSMFSAGVDTTASGLGFAVHDFVRFPGQWQLVREDPSLARNAFEETIRFESPVIGFFRTTTTEVVLGESRIPAQSKVLVFFAGANRDPRQFPEPNQFDIRRRVAGHLGYGADPHVCAGMNIARMEGEAIIRALAERVERWELDGEPQPRLNNSLRGLASLPVRVVPR
jgi:cytochrome P450